MLFVALLTIETPGPLLEIAALAAALSPMKFEPMKFPDVPASETRTPPSVLPERRFIAPATLPPMVLLVALLKTSTPYQPLATADAPVTAVQSDVPEIAVEDVVASRTATAS